MHFSVALAKLGYALKGTGYFGGATEAAVMDFQEQCDLEVDGEVGAETARAIDQAVAGATAVRGALAGRAAASAATRDRHTASLGDRRSEMAEPTGGTRRG